MEPRREKKRAPHVRTGCITCKRRRVKCSEEKPHCKRCIRGGFVCTGYNVPKPWIFQSSRDAETAVDKAVIDTFEPETLESGIELAPQREPSRPSSPSPSSLMQLGNSDPFHVYPVRLGPYETSLLQLRPSVMLASPHPVTHSYSGWMHTYRLDSPARIAECLEDQTTAYGLLAHNAALQFMLLKDHGVETSPSALFYFYTMRAQACLRRALSMTYTQRISARSLHDIVLTSGYLAGAESMLGLSTINIHVRAMSDMMMRHIELVASHWRTEKFIAIMHLGVVRALLSFERSLLDTAILLPRLSEDLWSKASGSPHVVRSNMSRYSPHKSIKDGKIREIMLDRMLQLETYNHIWRNNHNQQVRLFLCHAVEMEDYLHHAQLLDIAIDAQEDLAKSTLSRLTAHSIHAKVYIAVAIQLWIRIASPTNFTNNPVYDTAPILLPRLKMKLTESVLDGKDRALHEEEHAPARLWTLYVGLQTELQRIDRQALDPICGTWFLEAFQSQVSSMQVETWQEAVAIFKAFLYIEYVEPQISAWWKLLSPKCT